ncbi:MAG TPA: hypothetical protein VN436_06115, partial [Holophaga sp.]|nr:hypothetical protein [Holophaga sp.]
MDLRSLPALLLLCTAPLAAEMPLRIGLDTQATEWVVGLDGGGEVRSRSGKPLMKLKNGEKLRIWWDSRGEADPSDEYRIQVGPPLAQADADALLAKLKRFGQPGDRMKVAD